MDRNNAKMYIYSTNYQLSSHSSFPFAVVDVPAPPPISPCSFPAADVVSDETGVEEFANDDAAGPFRIAVVPITSDREPLR
jgi:hypothetical protein